MIEHGVIAVGDRHERRIDTTRDQFVDPCGGASGIRTFVGSSVHGDDPHAVEAAVARLRSGLGHKEIVATVVKRGYRLAIDEEH